MQWTQSMSSAATPTSGKTPNVVGTKLTFEPELRLYARHVDMSIQVILNLATLPLYHQRVLLVLLPAIPTLLLFHSYLHNTIYLSQHQNSPTIPSQCLWPTAPKLVDRTPDRKNSCKKCKKMTSRTLLDVNGVCGVCVWRGQSSKNVWEEPKKGAKY